MRPCASAKPNDHKVFVNGYLRIKPTLTQIFDNQHIISQMINSHYKNAIQHNRFILESLIGDKSSLVKDYQLTDMIQAIKQDPSRVEDLLKNI